MDVDQVYRGLADAINDAAIDIHGSRLLATHFGPDAITPPHFFPAEFEATYARTMGDQDSLTELVVTARLMLSRADDESGQVMARKLAGTGESSVRGAITAARGAPGQAALGGAADAVFVRGSRGPRLYEYGEASFYGLEFTIFVMG